MKTMIRNLGLAVAAGAFSLLASAALPEQAGGSVAYAQGEPKSIEELLRAVRQGRVRDNQEYREREAEFRAARDRQQSLLNQAEADLAAAEAEADRLEEEQRQNEQELAELGEELTERLGDFGELFGVVRQVAGETRSQLEQSMISAQYPDRVEEITGLLSSRDLPEISELEDLWYVLLQEMNEQSKVVEFSGPIVMPNGETESAEVIRIGPFTAVTSDNGDYVRWVPETSQLERLGRQPAGRFMDAADRLTDAEAGEIVRAAVDPSQGQILRLLVQTPNPTERVQQGGFVGYVIIGLGILGALLAILRIIRLSMVRGAVSSQMKNPNKPSKGNPLGRVLMAYQDNKSADTETLSLKLDEAVIKEIPALEWGLNTVKLLAAIAPLLGLLGTVTGMIIVFQQITLFGTGDPKLMAGGISQALVTTWLGLTTAVPLLLLHSFANGASKSVQQILEEQSAGLIARQAESGKAGSA